MTSGIDIVLQAQIPSGKNQVRTLYAVEKDGRKVPRKIPDARFVFWRELAGHEILEQRALWPAQFKKRLAQPVRLLISYHPLDNRVRDLPGMLDALFHLMVWTNILADDRWIRGVHWDYLNRTDGPCVKMRLEVCEESA